MPKVCRWEGCAAAVTVSTKCVGCSVTLTFKYSIGHVYTWHSSSQHANEKGSIFPTTCHWHRRLYSHGIHLPRLTLSNWNASHNPCSIGTNFLFINTNTWRSSCQCRYQNLYLIPVVTKFWQEHQQELLKDRSSNTYVSNLQYMLMNFF